MKKLRFHLAERRVMKLGLKPDIEAALPAQANTRGLSPETDLDLVLRSVVPGKLPPMGLAASCNGISAK